MSAASPGVARVSPQRFDFAEITALAMTVVIGVGAFAWSADALTELARMAGIRSQLAWIGPVFVDGAIVQSIVALVSLKRRERSGIEIPKATRWFFWSELALAELISVAGNALHAAESGHRLLPALVAATVAGAAPIAGFAASHGLTALLDVPRLATPQATPGDTEATAGDTWATPGDAEATTGDSGATEFVAEATVVEPDPIAVRDAEILRQHRAGRSYRQIGAEVGVHPGTVGKILARLGAVGDEPRALPPAPHFRLVAGGSPISEFTKE
ncbi:DUF2637 domain-containing protein [Nocardia sp. NPDC048505]|uniref:DUF2637 domain-containing protein n=1 Tax=Nocardia sp. NPDC048505 TaxID=3155756 RepID=UPI0033EFC109